MEIQIRPTKPEEVETVYEVHRGAFDGRQEEPHLVKLLHAADKAPVSLVAVLDGSIVGHILFSPMRLDPPEPSLGIVGLAPVGVVPGHQGRGIGSRLICEGPAASREAGYGAAVVLGEPSYYSQFGFGRASEQGIGNEYDVNEPFMAVELEDGALEGVRVTVGYQQEFRESGL